MTIMGWIIFLGSVLKGSLLLFSYLNNLRFHSLWTRLVNGVPEEVEIR